MGGVRPKITVTPFAQEIKKMEEKPPLGRAVSFLQAAAMCLAIGTTGCAELNQGGAMQTDQHQAKTQILDLIQRIMKAAESGGLVDEEAVTKSLGFWFHPQENVTYKTSRKLDTGIPILDKSPTREHVTYRGKNLPHFIWNLDLNSLGKLVCIRSDEVQSLFGSPDHIAPPPRGSFTQLQAEVYQKTTAEGIRTAWFSYAQGEKDAECLSAFYLKLVPKNRQIDIE